MIFKLLGAVTLKGNIMMFRSLAMNFVALEVVFIFLVVGRFFLFNIMLGLLIIYPSDFIDVTGLGNPVFHFIL